MQEKVNLHFLKKKKENSVVVVVVVATKNSATLGRTLRWRLAGRGVQEGERWKEGEEACSSSWVSPEVSDLEGRVIGIAFK